MILVGIGQRTDAVVGSNFRRKIRMHVLNRTSDNNLVTRTEGPKCLNHIAHHGQWLCSWNAHHNFFNCFAYFVYHNTAKKNYKSKFDLWSATFAVEEPDTNLKLGAIIARNSIIKKFYFNSTTIVSLFIDRSSGRWKI